MKNSTFDAVTVAPYMGKDSIKPHSWILENKWVIILALTSNQGAFDFQTLETKDGSQVFQQVLEKSSGWGTSDQIMYVVGATKPEQLAEIRAKLPEHFFLVPGVGAQGGDLSQVSIAGLNREGGLLVNSSRGIIYASSGKDFAEAAAREAAQLQTEMAILLEHRISNTD